MDKQLRPDIVTGHGDARIPIRSILAFTAWYISAISLDTGFDIPADEIPICRTNATVIGAVIA